MINTHISVAGCVEIQGHVESFPHTSMIQLKKGLLEEDQNNVPNPNAMD